jgi:signal transduction histidine kinase
MARVRFPDGRAITSEDMATIRALGGETVARFEHILYSQTQKRDLHVLSSASPITDSRGRVHGAVTVIRDVTQLYELDRLKDQFISVAAHELKTPIAIMKGYSQALLRTSMDLPSTCHKMLDAIDRGADRINRVVNELLDVSRLYEGHLDLTLERIDLLELVEETVGHFAVNATRHSFRVNEAVPIVLQGDRDRISQVLTNLVDNAIRYSPQGGLVEVNVSSNGQEAFVSVKDQGVGIPRDKQKRIFERFYRAHTGTPYDYGGMGVGLYISREIVQRHGGRMWFESAEGEGSTLHFALPLR